MGRHPIHEATLTVPLRGHQHFWSVMREMRRFTTDDVNGASNAHKNTIRDYIGRLAKAGIVKAVEPGANGGLVYEIVSDSGPEAPSVRRDGTLARRPGLGNEQMWRSMKMLGSFTPRDLAVAATTDDVAVKVTTAQAYVKHLQRAGYLAVVVPASHGGGLAVYRLVRNSGPLAPMIQRTDWVWDPNLRRVMGQETR